MNRSECAQLLTIVASYDRRTLGEPDVIAWQGALGDLRFDECRDAVVKHYAEQTDWLMPAHVRRLCLAARQDAAMRALPGDGRDLVPQPDWFRTTVEQHKLRTSEANRDRWRPGRGPMPKQRDERGDYGATVMAPHDGRAGW
jgi:hypothetical protein